MNRQPQRYLLTTVVALCLVFIVAEVWLLQRSRQAATRALTALNHKKQERDRLARQSPALSVENEAAIVADVATASRMLAELHTTLQDKDATLFVSTPPANSIDVYFELANFVEKLRTRAAQAQVLIKPDERFGFAAHANEGPGAEQIAAVHRQRLATQYLVEILLESRPLALVAVRRERPGDEISGAQLLNRADDYFALDRQLSLRQPGLVETEAFRLEFTGQTAALRGFLNTLATLRQLIVVRSVEVEPVPNALGKVPLSTVDEPVPLVKASVSKFSITLEFAMLPTAP